MGRYVEIISTLNKQYSVVATVETYRSEEGLKGGACEAEGGWREV
jgi:hypothetical protein